MVLSKAPHLSSVRNLKANLLYRPNNLLPALPLVTPVTRLRQAKGLRLKVRDLRLVRALLSEAKEDPLKLRGSSLYRSRNHLQAKNLPVVHHSSRGLPCPLDSSHREGHSNRGLPANKDALEHPPPSSHVLPLRVRGAQEDDPICNRSLSLHRSLVRTARLWVALHN